MIPKIIHYCWFGKTRLPDNVIKCISSWKKYCPDYEIKRWDEDNFIVENAPLYVKQAYENKKWAFVSDYVRLWAVYNFGGIYLDTDVELLKTLESLLQYNSFFGFESIQKNGEYYVSTGVGFGSEVNAKLIKIMMEDYYNIPFVKQDGSLDMMTCPIRNAHVFIDFGFIMNGESQCIEGIVLLAPEYLCPTRWYDDVCNITPNTISIHHFTKTWGNKRSGFFSITIKIIKLLLGDKLYKILKRLFKKNATN